MFYLTIFIDDEFHDHVIDTILFNSQEDRNKAIEFINNYSVDFCDDFYEDTLLKEVGKIVDFKHIDNHFVYI